MNNEKLALQKLHTTYESSDYFKKHKLDKDYRYQHTLRVASIAEKIAVKENLDREVTVIGALLHDISYANEFFSEEDWKNHGRNSKDMISTFLDELDLTSKQKEEIKIGIAIHVDGRSDVEGDITINARTISDSDNLDRIDIYRTFESLTYHEFYDKTNSEKTEYLEKRIESLEILLKEGIDDFATKTAVAMWESKIFEQEQIYKRLLNQLKSGKTMENKLNQV